MTVHHLERKGAFCLVGVVLLLAAAIVPAAAHSERQVAPWQAASPWPDRIVATFAGDPKTSLSVTWRTDDSVGWTIAQIAPATDDARFDLAAQSVRAKTERLDLETLVTEKGTRVTLENQGLGAVHYHSVTFEGLRPGTIYAYRVQGAYGQWSEWFHIKTAPVQGPVSFVYFGDAQNGILSHWSRVIRAAHKAAPDAGFYLHAGDLVNKGPSDEDWAQWFKAGGFLHASVPSMPVPGNHEFMSVFGEDREARTRVLTTLWRPQFTLPVEDELPERLHEAVYDVRYTDDLHVFVLSSTPASYNRETFAAQADWLDKGLSASDATWRVVTMHHPYWVPGRRERDKALVAAIGEIIDRHAVDLVLVGHIHTYARGSQPGKSLLVPKGTARAASGTEDTVRTMFMISSSGAKMFTAIDQIASGIGDGQPDLGAVSVDRVAGNTPMFQVIRIDGATLSYKAHTATGVVYDAFTLTKDEDGTKRLGNGEAAFGEMRLFGNTGPYEIWYDLP